MEIGSFIELQLPKGREWYRGTKDVARLNTGRAAIWHAFRLTGAKAIWIPYYQCDTVREFLKRKSCTIKYYHQDKYFNPIDLLPNENEAVLLVNYFGIMSQERMEMLSVQYSNVIIDNCQAFFCKPIFNTTNVYSCRKFVGVPDGAYVIGKDVHRFVDEYPQCYSSDTSVFLLKRIEYGCEGKGYESRSLNEHRIDAEDCMKMSHLTQALMDAEDYAYNQQKRKENFAYAHELLGKINKIDPTVYMNDVTIPMVYPLLIEDDDLLPRLQSAKHFQGHWWSYICDEQPVNSVEYWLSRYVIPITIDQRYGKKELEYISNIIKK